MTKPVWQTFLMKRILSVVLIALMGCTSLTPDRVNVLAAIAGQAAAIGAAEWLAKHPEHRDSFNAAIAALVALQKAGNTNEAAFVELMSSLPVNTLRGPDGELYVAGDGGLVVWDAALKKGVVVRGEATAPVMKATLSGLKRAMAPKPPAPVVARARKAGDLEGRGAEGEARTTLVYRGKTNVFIGLNQGQQPTNILHVEGAMRGYGLAYPLIGASTNNTLHSTFDVTLNEHGIQQVNVRWTANHPAIYTVQRSEDGKPWEGYASVTNAGVWTTLWPAPIAVGQWRVLRAQ